MNLKGKNIGKYIIGTIAVILLIIPLYKGYPLFNRDIKYECGVVVGKNDAMTTGKYPQQKFIIAFKFDNPTYGTQDINTAFHVWNSLNVGDRTAFKPDSRLHGMDMVWHLTFMISVCIIAMIMLLFIVHLLIVLWYL